MGIMSKLHIDEVYPKGSLCPTIVNFKNAFLTQAIKRKPCTVFENKLKGSKVIVTEVENRIYAGEDNQQNKKNVALLIRDKTSGKVRLVEVSNVGLNVIDKPESNTSELLESSYLEFSKKFGSKKFKKYVEQREKLKVNVETVTEQMKNVTETISEDQLDVSSYNTTDTDEFYVPPIDKSATKVEDVYDINKILTKQQLEQIQTELEGKDYKSDFGPWLKALIGDRTLTATEEILSVYINALVKFYVTPVKDIVKKAFIAYESSPTLNKVILSTFTTTLNGKRARPASYKDKVVCHIIVFTLLLCNFKFEMHGLCTALKMTPGTLTLKVKVTGANVDTSGNKKVVTLKLPLIMKTSFRKRRF